MMAIAAAWITGLLLGGGFALERVLTRQVENSYDNQLEDAEERADIVGGRSRRLGRYAFTAHGGDQRFFEVNSGVYWQISGGDREPYPSRSLWYRTLDVNDHTDEAAHFYDSYQFKTSRCAWSSGISSCQIATCNGPSPSHRPAKSWMHRFLESGAHLIWSFAILGLGLMIMAVLQSYYGLSPLRLRAGGNPVDAFGRSEQDPRSRFRSRSSLWVRMNALLAHSETQAEEARYARRNSASALKTPLTVDQRHRARSEAVGSGLPRNQDDAAPRRAPSGARKGRGCRATGHARAEVWPSAESVLRAVTRIYEETALRSLRQSWRRHPYPTAGP